MFLSLLSSSPWLAIVWVLAIVLSLTVHEFAHALVGKSLGDDTAEHMGRLTLNPLAHLDPIGFLFLLFAGFGWAKPVPFDPRRLKNPARDALFIALAGPLSNILLALIAGLLFRFGIGTFVPVDSLLAPFLFLLVLLNLLLAIFNLIPLYPLDGSKIIDVILPDTTFFRFKAYLAHYGPQALFLLVILSQFSSFDPFFVVRVPAFWLCDATLGQSCVDWFVRLFGG